MSGRYIIGGVAIAGAGYYLYQQRLEQARVPNSSGLALPTFGSRAKTSEGTGEYTGRQLDEAALKAKSRLEDFSHEAGKKIDHTLASAEQQRSKFNGWASDKLQDAKESLDAHADHAKEKADLLAKQAHRDDPGRLRQFGSEVKETIHDAGSSVSNSLHSAKNSIVGTKNAAEQRLENTKDSIYGSAQSAKDTITGSAEDAKNNAKSTWFNLGESKEEELARTTKKALEGWGETASANANEYYEAISDHTPRSKSWFSWGSRAQDNQDSLQKAYNDASNSYEDAKKRFNETKDSWFSLKDDANKKRLHAEAERQLDAAQKQLDSASSKLNAWFASAKSNAKDAFGSQVGGPKQYNGFYDWLRGGVPYREENIARVSHSAVRGWGDTADEVSREQYCNSKYSKKQVKGQYGDASVDLNKTAKEWNGWFNKKYDENAQGATDYYKDAEQALKDAQKELDAQSSHWWSWGQKKSKELELESKRNVEAAEQRLADATNGLTRWGINLSDKVLRGAEDAVKQTRAGLDKVNEKSQQGLGQAQSWIKEQQK